MIQDAIAIVIYIGLGLIMAALLFPQAWIGTIVFDLIAITTAIWSMRRHRMNTGRRTVLVILITVAFLSMVLVLG
jgi:hypothetical protein